MPRTPFYDKPTRDQLEEIIADSIDRGTRAGVKTSQGLASMILGDLKAAGVRLFQEKPDGE